MEFSKLAAPSLKELFIKEMEAMILSGKLEVGEKLPSERELAERLQVSRGIVNSGLSELARKGFLHVKPRSGVYVADYRRHGTIEILLSILDSNGGHLRRAEIRSILELKIVLDKLALDLAIPILTEDSLNAVKNKFAAMCEEPQTDRLAEAAFEFYHEIAMISSNTLLPLIYHSFRIPIIYLWTRYIKKNGKEALLGNAALVMAAIEDRDVDAAKAALESAVSGAMSGPNEIYED
ncbi:MAG: GntR family transcriptional regulator [Clostridiales bacterium]|nr:GntR family transcriptional regulator [Clostridiales bacterium]